MASNEMEITPERKNALLQSDDDNTTAKIDLTTVETAEKPKKNCNGRKSRSLSPKASSKTKKGGPTVNASDEANHNQILSLLTAIKEQNEGNLEDVKKLIKRGAKIHSTDKDKRTPLHLAAMNGHTDVIEELIKDEADVNFED
ncbi:poly [ADP-ribose] polymerase tankyrase-2-like, partial [Sitodiplosis mosellana]|uniref:poly [ADP-ribose] polymerase tankyrase-2-like n=1 Tax=Sitodiplosis mosellana TaxID=263140 RepID=UPI002443ECCE